MRLSFPNNISLTGDQVAQGIQLRLLDGLVQTDDKGKAFIRPSKNIESKDASEDLYLKEDDKRWPLLKAIQVIQAHYMLKEAEDAVQATEKQASAPDPSEAVEAKQTVEDAPV
jgi:hypothetical protein